MLRELFLVPATLLAGTLLTTPAAASPATGTAVTATGPATAVHYSRAASARQFNGLALDTCAAPSLTTMEAWTGSPYRAIGAYIGGASRTCRQDNLTRDWVTGVTTLGWGVLPIYKGLQPPCGARPADPKIGRDPQTARAQGWTAADDAVARVSALGMAGGSALYNDIENYSTADTTCSAAVLNYATGWTERLHLRGYLSGIYVNLSSGAQHLSATYSSTSYARPDAIWIARYVNGRSGPSTTYPVVETHPTGSAVSVVCQAPGSAVGSTTVWDKLTSGAYVTDYYLSTPSKTSWSGEVPQCRYPYQVSASTAVNERSGPGVSYAVTGSAPPGSLARVVCQRSGSIVGTTNVWDRLGNGSYLTDYYVTTPSKTTYSSPVPRC